MSLALTSLSHSLRRGVARHHLFVLVLLIGIQHRLDLTGGHVADREHLVPPVLSRKRGVLMQGIQLLGLILQDRTYLLLLVVRQVERLSQTLQWSLAYRACARH